MRWVIAFLLFAALLAGVVAKKGHGHKAKASDLYGELALKYVQPEFSAFEKGLKGLSKKTEPGHVKDIRGPLANARTFIDIFAYAYPTHSRVEGDAADASTDVYLVLVDDLTDGHFLLGEYSDLGTVHYSEKDKEKLLTKCLDWKEKYDGHAKKYNYAKFISNADKAKLHERKKSDLSGHFWGAVKDEPNEKNTGLENVAVLQDGQLKQVVDRYNKWRHLDKIWNEKIHEDFHNYRKDLRYLHQVGSKFKHIYKDTKEGLKAVTVADEAEHGLGPINNRIESYLYYVKKGDKGKAEKLKDEVESLWKKEKERLEKEKFVDVLEDARKNLIKH